MAWLSRAVAARPRRVEIVIPVRNVWWLGALVRRYRRVGLDPVWIVDETSHPLFHALARLLCPRRAVVRPTAPRAETMLAPVVDRLACAWVMRLDGDELPSDALVGLLRALEAGDDVGRPACIACDRRWLREAGFRPGGVIEVAQTPVFGADGRDPQYRLYRRAGLAFTEAIHTPGFVVPDSLEFCPPEICLWHLNWIVYTEAERRAKIAAYDAQSPGAGSDFRAFYLPEEARAGSFSWRALDEPAAAKAAARIARLTRSQPVRLLKTLAPA